MRSQIQIDHECAETREVARLLSGLEIPAGMRVDVSLRDGDATMRDGQYATSVHVQAWDEDGEEEALLVVGEGGLWVEDRETEREIRTSADLGALLKLAVRS